MLSDTMICICILRDIPPLGVGNGKRGSVLGTCIRLPNIRNVI